jgi:excisionase family DNA binding protein
MLSALTEEAILAEEEMFLTIEEIAERLRVSDRTVRRWIESGGLHAYKPGGEWRIPASDLATFLETRSSPKVSAPSSPTPAGPVDEERRVYDPEHASALQNQFEGLVRDFREILSICRRVMARNDFDQDLALVTAAASREFYNSADRYLNAVADLNAVEDALAAGADIPNDLVRAAADLRGVLFGPSGIQGVGAAAADRVDPNSPVRKLQVWNLETDTSNTSMKQAN